MNAPDVAKEWVVGKALDRVKNSLYNELCGSGIVLGNVVCFVIDVLQRFG